MRRHWLRMEKSLRKGEVLFSRNWVLIRNEKKSLKKRSKKKLSFEEKEKLPDNKKLKCISSFRKKMIWKSEQWPWKNYQKLMKWSCPLWQRNSKIWKGKLKWKSKERWKLKWINRKCYKKENLKGSEHCKNSVRLKKDTKKCRKTGRSSFKWNQKQTLMCPSKHFRQWKR